MENDAPEPSASSRALFLRLAVFATGALVVFATACSFMVRDSERAVVLRFGKPVQVVEEAGWYLRMPWPIDRVEKVDARLQYGEIRLSESLTRDKRNIIVPMYFAWRVADPLKFLRSVGTLEEAEGKLDSILSSARNSALGQMDYPSLLAHESAESPGLSNLEADILRLASSEAADFR